MVYTEIFITTLYTYTYCVQKECSLLLVHRIMTFTTVINDPDCVFFVMFPITSRYMYIVLYSFM